jgi:uncharacterized protein YjbJ (UPF0337 family)
MDLAPSDVTDHIVKEAVMPHEKEKIKGKMEQVGGKVKEEAGKLGGDASTEWSGKGEQVRGKIREGIADVRGEIEHRGVPPGGSEEEPESEMSPKVERKP